MLCIITSNPQTVQVFKKLPEVKNILEGWYGSDFLSIENPKNDDVLFVTVNGNRRITLTEISDREVRARFTDLSVEKKLKK